MEPSMTVCQLLFFSWIGPYWELSIPELPAGTGALMGQKKTFIGCSTSWGFLTVWKNCTSSSAEDDDVAGICTRSAYHRARWMVKGNSSSVTHELAKNGVFEENMSRHNHDKCLHQVYSSSHNKSSNRWPPSSTGNRGLCPGRQQNCRKGNVATFMVFLSEDLAALPLFSDKISVEEKVAVVNALQNDLSPSDVHWLAPTSEQDLHFQQTLHSHVCYSMLDEFVELSQSTEGVLDIFAQLLRWTW